MKMCRITEVQEACRTFDVSVKKNCMKSETNFLNLSCMTRASGNSIFFPVYTPWRLLRSPSITPVLPRASVNKFPMERDAF